MLVAGASARAIRACWTWELLEEHVVDADKGLRVLFRHGGCIWQCG